MFKQKTLEKELKSLRDASVNDGLSVDEKAYLLGAIHALEWFLGAGIVWCSASKFIRWRRENKSPFKV